MKYGFVRVATAVPAITPGNCKSNATEIIAIAKELDEKNVELVLFPELCLTSGNCGDIYRQRLFIDKCDEAIKNISEATKKLDSIIVFGAPVSIGYSLYDCAVIIHKGNIKGVVPKNRVSNRERQFTDGTTLPENTTTTVAGQAVPVCKETVFKTDGFNFGIEIGNDANSPFPPSAILATDGAEIILNPAAAAEFADSNRQTKNRIEEQSRRFKCGYMFANSGWGESTSDASYAGYNAIAECGHIIAEGALFRTSSQYSITEIDVEKIANRRRGDRNFTYNGNATFIYIDRKGNNDDDITRVINSTPFIPENKEERQGRFEEIFMIQATALARRIIHTRSECAVVGISGGLDSTLALLVTEKACRLAGKTSSDIIAVTMPGFGTTGRTYNNALKLMRSMSVTIREISIKDACIQHFKDIDHDTDVHDTTYENSQARERTQILMDIANQKNGIVVGTGDLSELALGWATYNGDHMSMYGVNSSVPKTLMQHLVRWVAENSSKEVHDTLMDIVETPISPELIPADNDNIKQKTEDLVGPYELHDFFLYNFIRNGFAPAKILYLAKIAFAGEYDNETINKWLSTFMRRFFTQQFKRSCMPDGPATGRCNLSSRNGWSMPADISGIHWNEN